MRNCRLCNVPMESSPFSMCSNCRIESEKVREFVLKHPELSLEVVSFLTKVSHHKVKKMVALGLKKEISS